MIEEMEALIRKLANIELTSNDWCSQCNAEYIQAKAEDLVVKLNAR